MRIITTERLIMNNFEIVDIDDLVEIIKDYTSSDISKYDQKWPTTKHELEKVLMWFSSDDTYLAVRTKQSRKVIGFVNITKEYIENPVTYNMGYIFHSKYHTIGFAYEACKAYIEYGKTRLLIKEIITGTAKENKASCKLLERLGFQLISEEKVHIQKDESGEPIEFLGCSYKLRI